MLKVLGFLILSFITQNILSQELTLIYPKNGQTVSDEIYIEWNEDEVSDDYLIQFSTDSNFTNITAFSSDSAKLNLKAADFSDRAYNWRVISRVNGLGQDTSIVSSFSIFITNEQDSLNLWLVSDSSKVTLVDDSLVTQWLDNSNDSSHTLIQNNRGLNPYIKGDVLNGYAAIRFENTLTNFCRLELTNKISSKYYSIHMVYNHYRDDFRRRILYNYRDWWMGIDSREFAISDSTYISGKANVSSQFVVHNAYSNKDTLYNYVNGIEFGKKEYIRRLDSTFRLGLDEPFSDILEIIMINDSISNLERQNIDQYLMDKYAPPVNLGPDRKVCSFPDSIELGIDYALNYEWSTNDTTDAIQIDSAGKYYVTITDLFNRKSVDSVFFNLDTSNYQVDFGFEDSTICAGDSIKLFAGSNRFSYQWNTSDTANYINAKTVGKYKVTVENCKGNFSTDSVQIFLNNPVFSLGEDTTSCFNSLIQLAPDSSFLTASYLWSTGEMTSSIIADTTDFYSLEVKDDYSCSYIDTIKITIDSSLFGLTLGSDTSLCEGNFITLQNPDTSIVSYLWSTGNTSPIQTIDTAGLYTVEFSDGNCTASDSIQISIQGLAPTADFSAQNFCFSDSVHFLDASTAQPGDVINSWSWDFDDGQSSTNSAPNHLFNSVNDFNVALKVTTDKNCSDTVSKIISIQPLPEANFVIDNFVSCSKKPIQFLDSTYISAGTISSYFWKFNDSLKVDDTANFANPVYTYDTLGEYTIELVATSNQGCKDTASKTEFINPSPEVAYSFSGTCLSDSTYFTDETFLVQGNIESYLWATNGQISLDKNPVFKYLNAGEKPITLRVTTVAGCQETLRDTLRIAENPVADFSSSLACIEDSFKLTNKSTSTDSIVRYNYTFGTNSSSLRNPSFYAPELGVFNIKLTVTTENACKDSIERQLQVEPSPKAAFTILNNRTGVPFDIELTNKSLRSVSYKWEFGNGDFSHDETPNYAYRDTGNYDLKLIVSSQEGCKDSITKQVVALPYFLDALLERIIVEENSAGELLVSAKVLNVGNNTIESLKFSVDLNKQYQIKESFNETIFRGSFLTVSFSGQFIVNEGKKVDFVCVKIEEVNGVEDGLLTNNTLCKNGFNKEIVLNAYPNPTSETLILDYVLPQKGELKINVYDQLGRKVLDEISTQAEEGFYQSRLNVINLRPGIYYYKFSLNGEELNGAFVKR